MYSVRVKILAMATALLVLFAAATGLSTLEMKWVVGELQAITDQHIPLSARVADIDVLTFELELQLRRVMDERPTDPAAIATLKTRHQAITRRLQADFASATAILEAAIVDPRNNLEDRLALARVQGSLEVLERRLAPFVEVGDQVLAAIETGDHERGRVLAAGFTAFESAFGEDIANIRRALDDLTRASVSESRSDQSHILVLNGGLFVVATICGLALFVVLTNRLQRAFRTLLDGTHAVESGRLDVALPITSRDELGQLAQAFNQMVLQLKEKERVKDTFGKYLDPRIVSRLVEGHADDAVISERRPATVFFSDIRSFSRMGENLTASTMVGLLNSYFTVVTHEIRTNHGIVDKYIGDSVMAFWTAPFSTSDGYAVDACLSALAQMRAIDAFRAELPQLIGLRRNLPDFVVHMGLTTGEAVIGTVGSDLSRSYTAIGDVVNAASRIEKVNKVYGTAILIDEPTWRLAQDAVEAREIDVVTVVGRDEPIRVFELLARAGDLAPQTRQAMDCYAAGLAAYRARQWDNAIDRFDACLALAPADPPARVMRARVEGLRLAPPGEDWDGVWKLVEK